MAVHIVVDTKPNIENRKVTSRIMIEFNVISIANANLVYNIPNGEL